MNFFEAFSKGDGSLKEPHFTSYLYYLLCETQKVIKQNSFLEFFINEYGLNEFEFTDEVDIRITIEEQLKYGVDRKDADLVIYLKTPQKKVIINIENKINYDAFVENQMEEQKRLLELLNPDSLVENILILPYKLNETKYNSDEYSIIYWYDLNSSLIQRITNYIGSLSIETLSTETALFLNGNKFFLNKFQETLRDQKKQNELAPRGPHNKTNLTNTQQLLRISEDWDIIFRENVNNVTVKDLREVWKERYISELREVYPEKEIPSKLEKWYGKTSDAQIKIHTINEPNRFSHKFKRGDKQIFYYPESVNGETDEQWRDKKIKPIHKMSETLNYLVYWKNPKTGIRETDVFKKN